MFGPAKTSDLVRLRFAIEQRWRWIAGSAAAVFAAVMLGNGHEITRDVGAAFTVGLVIGGIWLVHLTSDARSGQQWAFLYLFIPVLVLQLDRGHSELAASVWWLGLGISLLATLGAFYLAVFGLIAIFHRRLEASIDTVTDHSSSRNCGHWRDSR